MWLLQDSLSLKAISGISEKKGHIFDSRKVVSLNYTHSSSTCHITCPFPHNVPLPVFWSTRLFSPQKSPPLGKGEGGDRKARGKMEVSFEHGRISVRRSSVEGAGKSFHSARNQSSLPPGEAHFPSPCPRQFNTVLSRPVWALALDRVGLGLWQPHNKQTLQSVC